ncbi:methionine/alanine import family NSS transporter small subunit [Demequina sediminicola]|uniref:methionine/alanine import family NSS transporter small subunit n=1 Tax=Demequina sediminicola TaxID=1095026 RepID=UPI0009E3C89A|nr:methionine/alanine import family NSS transporter small subunit [Demequina sediminicola]
MSADAIVLMVITLTVVWGGLIVAILALRARPEREDMPEGGNDDEADGQGAVHGGEHE